MRTILLIAAVAVCLPMLAAAERQPELHAVTFEERADATRVAIATTDAPTFTAYTLEQPDRIVLDFPSTRMASTLPAAFTPESWVVSAAAAQQLDEGGPLVRVILTLARPARFDVASQGDRVFVTVTPRGVSAGEDTGRDVDTTELSQLRDELAKARRAQAEAAAAKAEARRAIAAARREAEQARHALSRARHVPVAAPATIALPQPPSVGSRVSAIAFRGRNGSGDLEIGLAGDAAVTSERVTRTYAELVLDGVDLGVDLERTIDVTKWGSPVRSVTAQRDRRVPRRVRVRIELLTAATPKLVRHARGFRWHVVENDVF